MIVYGIQFYFYMKTTNLVSTIFLEKCSFQMKP